MNVATNQKNMKNIRNIINATRLKTYSIIIDIQYHRIKLEGIMYI